MTPPPTTGVVGVLFTTARVIRCPCWAEVYPSNLHLYQCQTRPSHTTQLTGSSLYLCIDLLFWISITPIVCPPIDCSPDQLTCSFPFLQLYALYYIYHLWPLIHFILFLIIIVMLKNTLFIVLCPIWSFCILVSVRISDPYTIASRMHWLDTLFFRCTGNFSNMYFLVFQMHSTMTLFFLCLLALDLYSVFCLNTWFYQQTLILYL